MNPARYVQLTNGQIWKTYNGHTFFDGTKWVRAAELPSPLKITLRADNPKLTADIVRLLDEEPAPEIPQDYKPVEPEEPEEPEEHVPATEANDDEDDRL